MHVDTLKTRDGPPSKEPVLSYWCFTAGLAFHHILCQYPRSIILTSGTLAPLPSFATELLTSFPHTLENNHVISPDQVWVGVVPMGPTGKALNSSYKTRSDPAYMEDLGLAIANFLRVTPDGALVFFPSYSVMDACLQFWQGRELPGGGTLWERVTKHKAPVVEPRDSGRFAAAMEEFKSKVRKGIEFGCLGTVLLLFCVRW